MSRRGRQGEMLAGAMVDMRADYNAARSSHYRRKRTGLAPMGSGADYHFRNEGDYLRLMEMARDLDRNDLIIGQGVNRAVDNTIQDGFSPDAQTPSDGVNKNLMARWWDWAEDPRQCDVTGRHTFAQLEWLTLRHRLVDGDCIPIPLASGALQIVEAHRLRTPQRTKKNVVHGVLLNSQRRPLEYWFTKDDIDPTRPVPKVSDIRPIAAWDEDGEPQVFHVFDPKRASQTRGVSAFAPLFDTAMMIEDINFAKLVQQQIVSFFAILRSKSDDPQLFGASSDPVMGDRATETLAGGATRISEGIAPGMIYEGAPGETLAGFSPSVPNQEFFEHMSMELQFVSINLGLPLIAFLLDGRQTNFSGWRGAMDQARIGFRRNQTSLRDQFHRNVWRWKVRQWIAEDPALAAAAKELGGRIFDHDWGLPTWPYIEPLKDAQADAYRVEKRLISPRRQQTERGQDWDQTVEELVADHGKLVRRAAKEADAINQEYPAAMVDWRELCGMTAGAKPGPEAGTASGPDDRGATAEDIIDDIQANGPIRRALVTAMGGDNGNGHH